MKVLTKIIGINVAGFQCRHCKLNSNNIMIRICVTHGDNAKVIGHFFKNQVDAEAHGRNFCKNGSVDITYMRSIE